MGPYVHLTPLVEALVDDDPLRVRRLTRNTDGSFAISRMSQLPMVEIAAGEGAGGTSAMFFDDPTKSVQVNLFEACFYGGAMEVARDLASRIVPSFREPYFHLGDRLARYLSNPNIRHQADSEEVGMVSTYLQAGAKMRGKQKNGGWKAVFSAAVTRDGDSLNKFMFSSSETALPYALAESNEAGSTSALRHMLSEGAMAINDRSESGTTLLMHAVYGGNGRTTQMLLDAGADPKLEVKTSSGRVIHTAASLARVNNDDELVATIEAHAAHSAVGRVLDAVIRRKKP